ncbi:dephospho-CoA kinase [Sulfurihydrogenibium azorense Az-Fu1]|uniref:Dephospho-CoA kinase n=1 Tax=Sulfurihydrogenibium azorense (strain DSM 15241 / OCM 825 / Az-Fu1) TaxID=204536 RepID=C1DX37_SULAA|nr:dephospho-CoA kinase [Sulfurihydrogenibium azorense]ACN99105.1 dephospho-CoA kinase [Sulfurihydrogenibium azorense Az-Fu1]MDM7274484.1 dephospho-CoA kinase [Sulfurihydrogenibium azorense]
MKVIGLTGGIATGKSTAEKILQDLGCFVIDADKVVHSLYEDKKVLEEVKNHFPEAFEEDKLDKKKLANIIFSNPEKRKILESIIHPKVDQRIKEWLKEVKEKNPDAIAIVSVPLMIETGSYKNYEKVILIYAPKELQLERLLKKGFTKEEALSRINAQMDIEEKKEYATYIVENTGSIEEFKKKLEDLYKKLLKDC